MRSKEEMDNYLDRILPVLSIMVEDNNIDYQFVTLGAIADLLLVYGGWNTIEEKKVKNNNKLRTRPIK